MQESFLRGFVGVSSGSLGALRLGMKAKDGGPSPRIPGSIAGSPLRVWDPWACGLGMKAKDGGPSPRIPGSIVGSPLRVWDPSALCASG